MTLNARRVLSDCYLALDLLENEIDEDKWRVHWAGAVALIRAIGHVLHKVDGVDPAIRAAAERAYKHWISNDPTHLIFRNFIELERNNLLKEYRSSVYPLGEVKLAFQYTLAPVNGGDTVVVRDVADLPENIYKPMDDGPWQGDDARDVLLEALKWWETQLQMIDQEVDETR